MSERPRRRWSAWGATLFGVLALAWVLLSDSSRASAGAAAAEGRVRADGAAVSALRPAAERDPAGVSERPAPLEQASVLSAPSPEGRFGPAIPELGRSATLELQVTEQGIPVAATLRVLAGADAPSRREVEPAGSLVVGELTPGLALVEIATASGASCQREVLLRHGKTSRLQLDFGDLGLVAGRVLDPEGAPLHGASVMLDGEFARTDADGRFVVARRLSDVAALEVRHAGFATQRRFLDDALGAARPETDLVITLQKAAELVITLPSHTELPGAAPGDEVELLLAPRGDPAALAAGTLRSTYPWSQRASRRVTLGTELVFDDLPSCEIEVLAFHALGRGRPLSGWCRPGQVARLELSFEPTAPLEVRVLRGDLPAAGLEVELLVANPAAERVRLLGAQRTLVDRAPTGLLPNTRQRSWSDAEGLARFGAPSTTAYVRVSAAEGSLQFVARVEPGLPRLDVDLHELGR